MNEELLRKWPATSSNRGEVILLYKNAQQLVARGMKDTHTTAGSFM